MVRPSRDNARRMRSRKGPFAEAVGIRNPVRAAAPATVSLRCVGPVMHRFKAADRMRCPYCQHQTVIVGGVSS